MERRIQIDIPRTKLRINGKLRGSLRRPTVVFVHGLCCHMDEHLFYNGARWFEKNGYATFRFNLYDWQKGTRKLKDCTIGTHAADLDLVVRHLRSKGAKEIHVVGHSYGGPTILSSQDRDFQTVTLWDPTAKPTFKPYGGRRTSGLCLLPGAWDVVVGKKMFRENETLDSPARLERFPVPTKVICAANSPLAPIWKSAFARRKRTAHRFATVPKATHGFDEDGAEERLFGQTLDWIRAR